MQKAIKDMKEEEKNRQIFMNKHFSSSNYFPFGNFNRRMNARIESKQRLIKS